MVENAGNLLVSRHGELIASVGGDPAVSFELMAAYPDERTIEPDDCLWQGTQVLADASRMGREGRYPGVLYGRVVPGEQGRKWLQYWVWFYYNPKNLLGFGKHEGDWEMIQIELDADGRPDMLTYAQHKHGEVRKPTDKHVHWVERDGERHPVVYVAALPPPVPHRPRRRACDRRPHDSRRRRLRHGHVPAPGGSGRPARRRDDLEPRPPAQRPQRGDARSYTDMISRIMRSRSPSKRLSS